jgi:hypothetical protein
VLLPSRKDRFGLQAVLADLQTRKIQRTYRPAAVALLLVVAVPTHQRLIVLETIQRDVQPVKLEAD